MRRARRLIVALIIAQAHFLAAQAFEIKPVADNVYAAIAKPTFRTNCNAAIFILSHKVVVVDAESKPSAAHEVITQIKRLTDKPVTHLVITHLHGDHFQGASAYVNAWPGVQIVSSQSTRDGIETRGIPRMQRELVTVPQAIEKLNADLGKTTEESERATLQRQLSEAQSYLAELKEMPLALPNVTFDRHVTIYDDNDSIEVLFVGKGHSDGDVFVYYPKADNGRQLHLRLDTAAPISRRSRLQICDRWAWRCTAREGSIRPLEELFCRFVSRNRQRSCSGC